MPKINFQCPYCGLFFDEYLYGYEVENVECPTCKTRMKQENVKPENRKQDIFGYEKDLEYRKKFPLT